MTSNLNVCLPIFQTNNGKIVKAVIVPVHRSPVDAPHKGSVLLTAFAYHNALVFVLKQVYKLLNHTPYAVKEK